MTITARKILATAFVVPAMLLIGACGGTSSDDALTSADSAPAPADGRADGGVDLGVPEAVADESSADRPGDADSPKAQNRAVISKGRISLTTEDVEKARFELQKLLDRWDGVIATEESSADEDGTTRLARLELRIPSPRFATAMETLAELGTLVDRSRTSEDVTTQVIDIEARIRSQRASLARIEALLAEARDLTQVIAIETQLSRRQADLDSLEQQQKYLADQTTLSTITVYLAVPEEDDAEDDGGFWSGLKSGWEALGSSTEVALTVIGAVLPFAGVLVLVALPGWLVWRRRTGPADRSEG